MSNLKLEGVSLTFNETSGDVSAISPNLIYIFKVF